MARYLYLGQYHADGLQGIIAEGGTSRAEETRALFERVGGRIETHFWAFGSDCDFVIIADVPDHVAAHAPAILASATGRMDVRCIPLFSPEDLDAMSEVARETIYRAPGA
jgi:uncharacterized protein with GYD domain